MITVTVKKEGKKERGGGGGGGRDGGRTYHDLAILIMLTLMFYLINTFRFREDLIVLDN